MSKYAFQYLNSPVGQLRLIADEQHLIGVLWQQEHLHRFKEFQYEYVEHHPILDRTAQQLQEYFQQQRQHFDIPILAHGTDFQREVWQALNSIPYGEYCSYQQIAHLIGNAKAIRAVGTAIGQNPHSIIVPCHRVIGKNGHLTGFGGGLQHKAYLLTLEGVELKHKYL